MVDSVVVAMAVDLDIVGDPVHCYFVFPEHGQKVEHGQIVALRHFDIPILNPQVFHFVLKKVTGQHDVFVTSFYIRTAMMEKNNNTIPLIDLEQCICDFLEGRILLQFYLRVRIGSQLPWEYKTLRVAVG